MNKPIYNPQPPPREGEGIFPTFFMTGFECSTFIWKDGQRKDYVALTGHDQHLEKDYEQVMDLGMGVVREAVRWHLVDKGHGKYDWSTVQPILDHANACHLTVIWDLCHYGFPDNFDPFSEDAVKRFTDYCRAVTETVASQRAKDRFFTPINEITFFSGAATDMGWMYPFAKGRYADFKQAMCRMAIEGVKAIREIDPSARMVHVDPLIYQVHPPDRPDLADEAWEKTYEEAFEGWDILFGKLKPELGGSPEILDIVGVNVYNFSQAQLNADGSREVLGPRDPRRKPLNEMLKYAWERYHRPVIIGETSGYQDKRAEWLRMTMEESMIALNDGVDLQGVCLYPCVDIPDWNTGEFAKIGIFDLEDTERCSRLPHEPYIEELRRWQKILDRAEHIEPDSFGGGLGRVQLEEVRKHAREWEESGEKPQPAESKSGVA
jgi:beta-glucosidase/6-phospho-beta-glucosidase/beta-galactosidase